ncbi:class F sortase [Natronoglycomyces albus]|uniref:Class F sortase n=1 Tax=Natronoglycomyces albus TaxID=2811108 RepID=A0A895XQV8_9ACTN|nr:class F sortase [Natronoglycomyces albus]QSB06102.1 class F sortase [Natronoglycomyces albus]
MSDSSFMARLKEKGRRRSVIAGAAALLLLGLTAALVGIAVNIDGDISGEARSDITATEAPGPDARSDAGQADARDTSSSGEVLGASAPIALDIPAIDITASPLMRLGLLPDRHVEVPPYERNSRAGWYEHSPSPGQLGPSIILGHVDSQEFGPAIFHDQHELAKGDEIRIEREDGITAVFEVDRTVQYSKNNFPKREIYGNLDHAGLRLITCGGSFDLDAGSYEDNVVTYATLVDSFKT